MAGKITEKTGLLSSSGNADDFYERPQRNRSPRDSSAKSRSFSHTKSLTGAVARSTSITRSNTADLVTNPDDSSEKVPPLWSSSKAQLIILASLFLGDIFNFMSLSIMAPFFPQMAENKGMSSAVSGWVFGVFSLIQFAFAPVVGKLLPVMGTRFLLLSGMFFSGGCTILFGFVDKVPTYEDNNVTFTVFCFMIRIMLALGSTASSTATFAIAAKTFPDNTSSALGLLETGIGVGLMAGPALGGIMFEAGGFSLPFAFVGVLMILSMIVFYFVLPRENGNGRGEDAGSIVDLLKIPVVDLILVTIVVSALLWVGLDPILEPHLRQFDLSPAQVGLVFLLISGTYAILAPISGRIADRMENSTPLMIAGFAILTVGFLLLGPSPLLGLQSYNKLWLNIISLFILGVGISFTVVPTYDKILTAAEKAGLPDNQGTNAAVAGLWTSVYAFGEFIGPIYTGATFDSIGFSWSMTIIAIATFLMFFLTIALLVYERNTCCRKYKNEKSYSPLL